MATPSTDDSGGGGGRAVGSRDVIDMPRGRRLPLNSRRLTAAYLRQLGKALDIPTTGSSDELRQQIEGKLSEREDPDVQVVIQETPQVETVLWLVSAEGPFLQTTPVHYTCRGSSEAEQACRELEDANAHLTSELTAIRKQLQEAHVETRRLQEELEVSQVESGAGLDAEIERLKAELKAEKERCRQLWKTSCEQVAKQDAQLANLKVEIEALKARLVAAAPTKSAPVPTLGDEPVQTPEQSGSTLPPPPHTHTASPIGADLTHLSAAPPRTHGTRARRGKAPPVISFSGENVDVQLDDWLPALERASAWNSWTDEDLVLQIAGHLRGCALQEWNLLNEVDKATYAKASAALRERLDPGNKTLVAQDFRHVPTPGRECG